MKLATYAVTLLCLLLCLGAKGQGDAVYVNLAMLDGIELTPDNIFNYQIGNNTGSSKQVIVKGNVHYRNSGLSFSYTFTTFLGAGVNFISADKATGVSWNFSTSSLRELFFDHKKLPQGTYEYCVEVMFSAANIESTITDPERSCLYYKVEDIFLINLVDPENDARIHEYYPSFSWVVNYPFASELTYRFRLTDVKKGQTNEVAIVRNPLIYEDKNVFATTTVYPVTAKPLEKWQPYAWTVDAYYKGILLGGAEVWRFTIVEDTLLEPVSADPSYVELNVERGNSVVYAPGLIKLKHIENERFIDTLTLALFDEEDRQIKLPESKWINKKGDNRKIIKFHEVINLKHLAQYKIVAVTETGRRYTVSFKYFNPLYLKK